MKKIFLFPSLFFGILLVTGCGELSSFSNGYDNNKPVFQSSQNEIINKKSVVIETPESRRNNLISTAEGCLLFAGWYEAEDYGYDSSVLTKEERYLAIEKGVKSLSELAEKDDCGGYISEIFALYYSLKKDTKKMLNWAFKGAEKDSSPCMSILSDAYRSGEGMVQDYEEGFKWTYLAAATGNEWSKNWIKKANELCLKNQYAPEYLSPMMKEAKKRANQWMLEHSEVFISLE